MSALITRRNLLIGAGALGGAGLAGCDAVSDSALAGGVLPIGERVSMGVQRTLMAHRPLAREFAAEDLSRQFKANGSVGVGGEAYARMVESRFADYRLPITGLVARPLLFTLDQLKAFPSRTQITRHDCVEGWSAIGGWTGVRLGQLLQAARLLPEARFILFRCMDQLEAGPLGQYYETIDLIDAFHPQTILAYAMNGQDLPVPHGAPLRLRVERHLGYKHAKFISSIEVIGDFRNIGGGKGGFWEDRGYEWYAGI